MKTLHPVNIAKPQKHEVEKYEPKLKRLTQIAASVCSMPDDMARQRQPGTRCSSQPVRFQALRAVSPSGLGAVEVERLSGILPSRCSKFFGSCIASERRISSVQTCDAPPTVQTESLFFRSPFSSSPSCKESAKVLKTTIQYLPERWPQWLLPHTPCAMSRP